MKRDVVKIANAQAFWGDQNEAAARLLQEQPDLDYITLDYLSEVSMSIMAGQKAKDPRFGYAHDFIDVIKSLAPYWKRGAKVKIITNAGGLNPRGCAQACADALRQASCHGLHIGIVSGDDVLDRIKCTPDNPLFHNMDTSEPISNILDRLTTANAYLGAKPIVDALHLGADIVITGRTADPSLTVAPCVAYHGWCWDDYDRIAQATVAGHLIECGTQATGGISTDWLAIADVNDIGFPFVEVDRDAHFVLTKPRNTGGLVSIDTVTEQLLYEIGDPAAYLSPDVTLSFLSLSLEETGKNRILIKGAKGKPPPSTYKVSATYRNGYKAEGTLAVFGEDCKNKAQRCGQIVLERMKRHGMIPQRSLIECLGCGDVVTGIAPFGNHSSLPFECMLRICIADPRLEVLEYFSKQIAPLVTAGPQGVTGYTSGRPHIRPLFGFWPCSIPTSLVTPNIDILEVKQ